MAVSGRGGDSLRGKAGTQPSSVGGSCKEALSNRAVAQCKGLRYRPEDHLEQPRAPVASELEDCFSVVASLHLIPARSLDFLLVCLAVQRASPPACSAIPSDSAQVICPSARPRCQQHCLSFRCLAPVWSPILSVLLVSPQAIKTMSSKL